MPFARTAPPQGRLAGRGASVGLTSRAGRALVVGALALALSGCPEERPGAAREIPPQRVPPAMPLEPQPAPPPRMPDITAAPQPGEAAPRAPTPARSDARP